MVVVEEEHQFFEDRFQFVDDIHGRILLNNLERDAIDTPEFQRLFRISQLGLVEITYQTGNHTRGAHSIGTCYAAQKLITALTHNHERGAFDAPEITGAEKVLIRLGALLHDIPHGPFSHDIEKKKHLIKRFEKPVKVKSTSGAYEKHDDYKENPAFYIAVFDTDRSILARVLRMYSPYFYQYLARDEAIAGRDHYLQKFLKIAGEWPNIENELLPNLLFHLFAFEEIEDAEHHTVPVRKTFGGPIIDWHVGPPNLAKELHEAWYQPFRHEIIGNTLSADLMDYLARDCARLHIKGGIDDHLLRYYVLTPADAQPARYRCAIDIYDHKRGIVRSDRLNDIFQMLEVRHQIHEKAVYHRVSQSSLAMLSRAITLGHRAERKIAGSETPREPLTAESMYGFDTPTEIPGVKGDVAMRGDEHFLARLTLHDHPPTRQLSRKLSERRLFRPLMIVPGHRTAKLMARSFATDENNLRELATIIDAPVYAPFFNVIATTVEGLLRHEFITDDIDQDEAPPGSAAAFLEQFTSSDAASNVPPSHRVLFWTLPYKQLFKDPAIVVTTPGGQPRSLDQIKDLEPRPEDVELALIKARVDAGIKDADVRYSQLWKIYVFLSDGLFYGGSIAKLLRGDADYSRGCAQEWPAGDDAVNATQDAEPPHVMHLRSAGKLAARAISVAWDYWDREPFSEPRHASAAAFLNSAPSDQMMRTLIRNVRNWPITGQHASEVRFGQYEHGEGHSKIRCRDIRYRFEEATVVADNHPMKALLDALACDRTFVASELNDLALTLLPDEDLITAIAAAESPTMVNRLLRERAFASRLAAAGITLESPVEQIATGTLAEVTTEVAASAQLPLSGTQARFLDDTTQAQELLARARKAQNERRYSSAAEYVEHVLRIPNPTGALDGFHTEAQLLRVRIVLDELAATKSDRDSSQRTLRSLTNAEEVLSGIRIGDDEQVMTEVNRLRGVIAWRQQEMSLPARVPKRLLIRGDRETRERQEQFIIIATERLRPRKNRARTPREIWNAIEKEAWET